MANCNKWMNEVVPEMRVSVLVEVMHAAIYLILILQERRQLAMPLLVEEWVVRRFFQAL
jgi:hypothetical protein